MSTIEEQEQEQVARAEAIPGARKAAVVIAALAPELSAQVITHLREDEVETLSREMTRLDAVGKPTTETIMAELAAEAGEQLSVSGGMEVARDVLERAFGSERTSQLLGRLARGGDAHPFEFLRGTAPDQIASFLQSESPQTTALVLANLNSTLAAQVLGKLPEQNRPDIAHRIARLGEPSTDLLRQLEDLIRQKLGMVVEQEYPSAGGASALANILAHSDRSVEHAVLDHLGVEDAELAEEVRDRLFVFEDLIKLDDRAIQQVLREADQKDLVLALRGATDVITDCVVRNMSERGAEMLKEEIEVQQPQRRLDVYAAQGRIVAVVRQLEELGTIVINRGGEDPAEELV